MIRLCRSGFLKVDAGRCRDWNDMGTGGSKWLACVRAVTRPQARKAFLGWLAGLNHAGRPELRLDVARS